MDRETKAWIAGIVIVIALVFGAWRFVVYLQTNTYDQQMTVNDLNWRRIISVEMYQTVHKDTDEDDMPADAFNIQRYTETHQCGSIPVGKVDVPQYCTYDMARYDLNRWVWNHDVIAHGGPKDEIVWPDFAPSKPDGNEIPLGSERESGRRQELNIDFITPQNKWFTYNAPDYPTWVKFAQGQRYTVKINRLENPFWETLTPNE